MYDGEGQTEILSYTHKNLVTGTQYFYTLEVMNFNGPSEEADWVERHACETPADFTSLFVSLESSAMTTLVWR